MRASSPGCQQPVEVAGLLDGDREALGGGEPEKRPDRPAVDACAGPSADAEAGTARGQESVEGLDARTHRARLDPGNRRLRNPRTCSEVTLR
jgi:hypothetical protein